MAAVVSQAGDTWYVSLTEPNVATLQGLLLFAAPNFAKERQQSKWLDTNATLLRELIVPARTKCGMDPNCVVLSRANLFTL